MESTDPAAICVLLVGRPAQGGKPFLWREEDLVRHGRWRARVRPIIDAKGDFIAILVGHKAPVVLRPVDSDRYNFVGKAYVDGVMDGEAMEEGKINGGDFKMI
jgi:hypothetical protein